MKPRQTLELFDGFLSKRRIAFKAVIIGGAALERQDAHPEWPAHVRDTLRALAERLGHDIQ